MSGGIHKVIEVRVRCGCGWWGTSIHDGLAHAEETQHRLDIIGSIDIKREVETDGSK
jgi:hypothetical protein